VNPSEYDEGVARPEPVKSVNVRDANLRIINEMQSISTFAARAWLIRTYGEYRFTPELVAEYFVRFIRQVNGQPSDLFCEIYHQALCHVLGARHLCDIAIPTWQYIKMKSEFWRMTDRDVLEQRMLEWILDWTHFTFDDVHQYIRQWDGEDCKKDGDDE
jgi:hypothetical protein